MLGGPVAALSHSLFKVRGQRFTLSTRLQLHLPLFYGRSVFSRSTKQPRRLTSHKVLFTATVASRLMFIDGCPRQSREEEEEES